MENNTGTDPQEDPAPTLETRSFTSLDIAKLAITAANLGVWFIDEQTGTFLPSARMKELHGYLAEEEMSFEAALVQIPKKYRQKVISVLKEARSRKEPFYLEYPVIGFHDQQQRWLRVMGGSEQPTTETSQFSGVIMDITDIKQNELRRSKFIGMVSHELKTPLTALKAYIQLLNKWAKQKRDSFSIGALSKLEKQVKKMTTMINGFLNFSGAESGKIHLNKSTFDMIPLLNEVIEENKDIYPDHAISLAASQQMVVNADRDKIEQVIINLISNAVKYSDPGKPIAVTCLQEKTRLILSVKDTGMGIEEKDIAKLFKPHSRIKTSKTENISGFGIGLYLCAEIIKYHGGEIGVKSEPGHGSTFWFSLKMKEQP
ncbi:sensor histidine kinase [Pedobacter heparinus]|uniref:histidine kinase n=1 Tax=Pedobacter heparinus (strain ATCC 13125 / DSM 2366 / CIP 104194 / JCM 7457 / NBRC 12017 / NCIMB 9290 / NRRL B-14731 / HIM 762-3) TaxID=485917 RepID=C6Y1T4_PEDHD|nr:HAMP domain-containing sensor histidine kinase [Pedobacter heparinus]ACU05076.1 PAS sensor protein [Pedobacter heparinus DSM 2366]